MRQLHGGLVLAGRYQLANRIASGGMGEVWEATDQVLERRVALKAMHPPAQADQDHLDRFRDEARNAASLSHPHIVAVHDYGEDKGRSFLVMELVNGSNLAEVIAAEGPLDAAWVRSLLHQLASALDAAHTVGIVHRDLKPANVILGEDGLAKLMDFGISRSNQPSVTTRTGEVLGTAYYLSPEQALGHPATPRSDLYALGVIGHELLTGSRPFDRGTPVATALAQIHEPPPPLPGDIPAELAQVILACLAKDPQQRPPTARAVATMLGGQPEPAAAPVTPELPPAGPLPRRAILP